jgi:autotransporter-associated beta strand protein
MNSGSGGGTLSLSNSNNDYTGGTTLANSGIFVPTLKLNSNTALGTGPLFLSGGNVSAGSVFSIPTRITMAGSNVTFGGTNALRFNGAIDMIGINTLSRNFFDGPMVTLAGIIRGTGALTKNGNHVLRLLGNNTYTGSTLATEGTLGIYGNQPSSAVGVVKNSTAASRLTGDGTLGFLSASKRGIVAPAAGNAFTQLTASGANFSDLGILRLRMGNDIATGADFDSLSVGTGRLIVGPQSILQFDLASATAPRTALGLVHYGARLGVTNQFPAPTLLNNPNGYVASVTYTATDLNLTLASPTTLSAIQADDFFRELGEDNESV